MDSDVTKIASAWLVAHENLWAHHELGRLCEEEPIPAWRVIEAMIDHAKDADTLKLIGVGPLEDLLSDRGADVIDYIERSAQVQPKIAVCLSAMAKSTTEDTVWKRVQRLIGSSHAV
jgi:hypothetical protein